MEEPQYRAPVPQRKKEKKHFLKQQIHYEPIRNQRKAVDSIKQQAQRSKQQIHYEPIRNQRRAVDSIKQQTQRSRPRSNLKTEKSIYYQPDNLADQQVELVDQAPQSQYQPRTQMNVYQQPANESESEPETEPETETATATEQSVEENPKHQIFSEESNNPNDMVLKSLSFRTKTFERKTSKNITPEQKSQTIPMPEDEEIEGQDYILVPLTEEELAALGDDLEVKQQSIGNDQQFLINDQYFTTQTPDLIDVIDAEALKKLTNFKKNSS